jgi:hypothetical protein
MMIAGSGMVLVLLPLRRILHGAGAGAVVSNVMRSQRAQFLGSSPLVGAISVYLKEHAEFGLSAIGYLDDRAARTERPAGRAPHRMYHRADADRL